jgi:V/A-type H+/Na+-transporting ATPase subunit D
MPTSEMAMARIPPGRSGRLWLIRRLSTAAHAADLLDRKLRILRTEQERLARRADHTAAAWRDACQHADTWGLRAALTCGQRGLRLAAGAPAAVEIEWHHLMGARHPGEARCAIPDPTPTPGGAALVEAATAYRDALRAAAAHAAAEAALRVVATEVAATRHRLRAVTERWIPKLETGLRERNRQLEETELAETARLRRATRPAFM